MASSTDLWFHLRGAPGAHVLLVTHGRAPSDAAIEAAARVAGYFSTQRDERAVDVIVAEPRHVSRAPGGHPGQVIVRQERVLRVPALLPEGLEEETR
jgi:predicted ribosome quality control (RQC) complex YloA/Tae2 family protein